MDTNNESLFSWVAQSPVLPLLSIVALLLLLVGYKLHIVNQRRQRSEHIGKLDPRRDAQLLWRLIATVEFPFLYRLALEFALVRVVGIPSISRVLDATGESRLRAGKRYDDTDLLLLEILTNHVDSARGSLALRRLNAIHGAYKIDNNDYLYTLALFVLMPEQWIARYGFRDLSAAEREALFVVWRDVGMRMGIQNLPLTRAELLAFAATYEEQHMRFEETNSRVADSFLDLYLGRVPWPLRGWLRRAMYATLDSRFRTALGYPRQPAWLESLMHGVLRLAGAAVALALPPRSLTQPVQRIPSGTSRIDRGNLEEENVYVPCFHLHACTYAKGYRIEELGPRPPGVLGQAAEGELLCPFLGEKGLLSELPPEAAKGGKTD